jgi:hypothetical protein
MSVDNGQPRNRIVIEMAGKTKEKHFSKGLKYGKIYHWVRRFWPLNQTELRKEILNTQGGLGRYA